jgi:natural product biosynthesis luciferase-like monooxygenase protein
MTSLSDRLARLTPEQRALLERRLKGRPAHSAGDAEPRWTASGAAAQLPLSLPAAVVEELRQLARRRQAPLSTVLLAAFAVLLCRGTGRTREVLDLILPAAGDDTARLDCRPICIDLGGDPLFVEALDRLTTAVREEPPQAAFAWLEEGYGLTDIPGLPDGAGGAETATRELVLWLREGSGDLEGGLIYDTRRLASLRVQGLALHLSELLRGIAADPARRIAELPLYGGELAGRLFPEIAVPLRETSFHRLFAEQVRRTPDAVAVSCRDRILTYRELDRGADRIARLLRRQGGGPGSRCVLALALSPDWLAALLAVFRTGGTAVLLDPDESPEGLADAVADTRPQWLLTAGGTARPEIPGPALLEIDLARSEPADEAAAVPLPESSAAEPALLCLGACPPGGRRWVLLGLSSLAQLFRAVGDVVACSPGDAFAVLSSPASPGGWVEVLWPLTRGAEVVFAPAEPAVRPRRSAGRRPLDFSLFYFATEESREGPHKQRLLLDGARFADRHGFTAVWTPERHFHPFGGLFPNPAVTSAALAMITRRVHLRAGSVVMPLHHPLRVAEEWSLVDNFSGGRAGMAFASGWHANDFVFFPDHYKARREVMLRGVDTVRRLWRGEAVTALSGSGKETEVRIFPRPIQPELPVWITAAATPGTFTLAGEIGVNVLTHLLGQGLERVAERIRRYRETRAEHGHDPHDPQTGRVTLMLHTFVGDSLGAVRKTVRGPFSEYIRSFTGLLDDLARNLDMDLGQSLSGEDMERLQAFAFERSYGSGLFGTPRSCLEMIRALEEIGVDEIACLIDFGVATEDVLASLHHLDRLRELARKPAPPPPLPAPRRPVSVVHLDAPQTAGVRELLAGGSVRAVLLDGDATGQALPAGPGRFSFHGAAETGGWSSRLEPGAEAEARSVLRPLAGTQLFVLGRNLAAAPIGVTGELCIQGESLACGYLDRPDLTAARFSPSPFSSSEGQRLFHTGQAARYLLDGSIEWMEQTLGD